MWVVCKLFLPSLALIFDRYTTNASAYLMHLQNELSTFTAGELLPDTRFTATANVFTTNNTRIQLNSRGIFRTLAKKYRPMPVSPKGISVRYVLGKENNLRAIIKWKPAPDMVCQYHLSFYSRTSLDVHLFGKITNVSAKTTRAHFSRPICDVIQSHFRGLSQNTHARQDLQINRFR